MAEQEQVGVYAFRLRTRPGLAVRHENGECDIALDMEVIQTEAEEKTVLGHEMGHCMTGSFYNPNALYGERQRNEIRATRWMIRKLIPFEEMLDAMRDGIVTWWELADHFGVTEDTVKKAYQYYTGPCGLEF